MPKFELTAKHEMNQNGLHVDRGQQLTVTIPMMGIAPVNLFTNARCKDALRQQFAVNGLPLPPNSSWLTGGLWDVKMVK